MLNFRLAALFLFKCDYLLPSHVEFILTRALSHRLTPKTTVRDMIEHNETVINDVFGSVLKYL